MRGSLWVPVANVRTKNPGGVRRRSERTWPSSLDGTIAENVVSPVLRTIGHDACSCLLSRPVFHRNRAAEPSAWFRGEGITSGKNERALLATGQGDTAVLQEHLRGLVFDASWPTVPLKFDVGD